mmetsp:Transcript_18828/g.44708  ORF Transcript_18828/g.44708 Transcript_18828/m.44708 type:complete len:274 (+) Transcript_18828:664-1485(+)
MVLDVRGCGHHHLEARVEQLRALTLAGSGEEEPAAEQEQHQHRQQSCPNAGAQEEPKQNQVHKGDDQAADRREGEGIRGLDGLPEQGPEVLEVCQLVLEGLRADGAEGFRHGAAELLGHHLRHAETAVSRHRLTELHPGHRHALRIGVIADGGGQGFEGEGGADCVLDGGRPACFQQGPVRGQGIVWRHFVGPGPRGRVQRLEAHITARQANHVEVLRRLAPNVREEVTVGAAGVEERVGAARELRHLPRDGALNVAAIQLVRLVASAALLAG